ncbi:MAG: glycoside hydrolase family 1 protein [Patescibacteria group bacterium]
MQYRFPQNFYWGAATSAHQVEGGLTNDWSEWERANASRLAAAAKEYWQSWQQEKFPEMFGEANYISGQAGDQFNRYEADFDLAKQLGHNALRFSIDWSRVEPREGEFDERVLDHYLQVIEALRRRNIEPLVTFYHWPLPLWLSQKGGWENRRVVEYFVRYGAKLGQHFKNKIKYIITINEPLVFTGHGYITGEWPPGKKDYLAYYLVVGKLIQAHQQVYGVLKEIDNNFLIGVAQQNAWFEAAGNKLVNRMLKSVADWWNNQMFLEKINNYQDFIGLNHYFHHLIDGGWGKNKNERVSDLGWELVPESLYHCLLELKRFNKPVVITEHGLADRDDQLRPWFITESLKWAHRAMTEGVDLRGYLHWSLIDNFEWSSGFWPRFGLVAVDFETQKRTPRPSAYVLKKIIVDNGM